MAIPETQLSTWAAPPGDSKAQAAYGQVRRALEGSPALQSKTLDRYLQGSYRNRTHIRADSDVDVVAELQSSFFYNIDRLGEPEKALFKQLVPDATYLFAHFKRDVLQALVDAFGANSVTEGNKCLNVAGNPDRSNADVLACLEHHTYRSFARDRQKDYIPGIKFFTKSGAIVINWPKAHYQNGSAKNQNTDEKFKHLVRIFKHIRRLLVEATDLTNDVAPSYFIECLLFNVPDHLFSPTYSASLSNALGYLRDADYSKFVCVNRQEYLFGGANGWNADEAKVFVHLVDNENEAV